MQGRPFAVFEVVTATCEDLVERDQLDDLAFGKVGRFVEHETPIVNVSLQGLHSSRLYCGGTAPAIGIRSGPSHPEPVAVRRDIKLALVVQR